MAGINSRAELTPILEPTLKMAFFYEYNLGGDQYPQYWDVQDSYKSKETIVETVIPSKVPQISEGGMYARAELKMGRSQTFVHASYKLEIIMTEELAEDNLYPAALDTQKSLAITTKRTVEWLAATTFGNGLLSKIGVDGQPIFSAAHPVLYPQGTNPTTWGNVLAGQPFDSYGVKKLKILMKKQRDENGDLAPHEMDQLIVPIDLGEEALEMYDSANTYDRADNTPNQTKKGLVRPIVVDHLTDCTHPWPATQYFGRDSRLAKNIFFWRVKPEYRLIYEEATGNVIQRVRFRLSMDFVNPRGLVAAYS
jgi:hypothetical protein